MIELTKICICIKEKTKKKQESIQTIKNNNYVNVTCYPFIT